VSCLLGGSFNGSDFCYIFAIGSSLSIVANNQNNIVGWSERTSLEAVDTFSTTICFKTLQLCFLQQIASVRSETYFTSPKCHAKLCAIPRTLYNGQVPCYCCVTWYKIPIALFFIVT